LSVKIDFEHHEIEESEEPILQRHCEETLEPTRLKFIDDILFIEYEYFSCGFDVNVGLDVDLCAEYEPFSFDPIRIDHLYGNCKSKFVECRSIATKNFALNQFIHILVLRDLWILHPLFCLDRSFMMT